MNPIHLCIISEAAESLRDEAIALLQELVRIPSVNHPPTGDERTVQEAYAERLRAIGLRVDLSEPLETPGFEDHPARMKSHDMRGRPNVVGVWDGSGGGRSLMLWAHADTEQTGDPSLWEGGDPLSGELRNGRIYGRGSGDDKSGMAIGAMVVRTLQEAGLRLKGDLLVASVSDEEQGGGNGTVGVLCRGYRADSSIYVDGVNMEAALSSLGGGHGTLRLRVPAPQRDASALIELFDGLRPHISEFKRIREVELSAHQHYASEQYASVAVRLMNVQLGTCDNTEGSFQVWFYLLPGEDPAALQERFEAFLRQTDVRGSWRIEWLERFLEGSEVSSLEPFVASFAEAYRSVLGREPTFGGSPMSDMWIVNRHGGHPCLFFGPIRWGMEGMAHTPDEFVEVERVMECVKVIALCAVHWCGAERQ